MQRCLTEVPGTFGHSARLDCLRAANQPSRQANNNIGAGNASAMMSPSVGASSRSADADRVIKAAASVRLRAVIRHSGVGAVITCRTIQYCNSR